MLLKFKTLIVVIFCFVGVSRLVVAASLEKAILFNEHGLTVDAKRELIDLIFEKGSSTDDKAQAYYLLGNIAFGEDKIKAALNSWEYLVNKYPNSNEAELVRDRITQLSEIVVGSAKENLDNAVARSYLRHADFWSEDKSNVFNIDGSWIPKIEAAVKWYDKVITEFPKSEASRIAYEGKLKTLLGWKEPGRDGDAYGIEANFNKYMSQMLQTFEEFEKTHPDASTLQAFRYQIAQACWGQYIIFQAQGNFKFTLKQQEEAQNYNEKAEKNLEAVKVWLNKIIDESRDNDSFYRDLANRCLKNLVPKPIALPPIRK